MTRVQRLALVGAVLFLLGAAAATTFAPSNKSGMACGTWVDRYQDRDPETVLIIEITTGIPDGATPEQDEFLDQMDALDALEQRCDERLDSRRQVSLVVVGLAIAVPVGALLLGARRRHRT